MRLRNEVSDIVYVIGLALMGVVAWGTASMYFSGQSAGIAEHLLMMLALASSMAMLLTVSVIHRRWSEKAGVQVVLTMSRPEEPKGKMLS